MNAVAAAWLLACFVLFLFAARVAITDLRGPRHGRSWDDCCLDHRDGLACGCVPKQRQPYDISGRL